MDQLYSYVPGFCREINFSTIYSKLDQLCDRPMMDYGTGKLYPNPRKSCVFVKTDNVEKDYKNMCTLQDYGYTKYPIYFMKQPDYLNKTITAPDEFMYVYNKICNYTNVSFGYTLVHIYENGKDYMGYHNDKEALNSNVCSISLGETRKFRFRPFDNKKNMTEYKLNHGDLFWMKAPKLDKTQGL